MRFPSGPQTPAYTYSFSAGAIVFLAFPWVNALLRTWGYLPYRGIGIVLGVGLMLLIGLFSAGLDYLLYRLGVEYAARSGAWLAAGFGPLAGFALSNQGNDPLWGRVVGTLFSLLAFAVGYFLSKRVKR